MSRIFKHKIIKSRITQNCVKNTHMLDSYVYFLEKISLAVLIYKVMNICRLNKTIKEL